MRRRYPDARIIVADNLKRRGSELNLARLAAHQITFAHADVRNAEDLTFPGYAFDLLLECSAEPSVLAGFDAGPTYLINTNLIGTVNCLEVARRCSSDFIFLSTSRVYPIEALESIRVDELDDRFEISASQSLAGVGPAGIDENFPLEGARSLYGTTKLCSEHLIVEYANMFGLRYVIDRCGVITGPWQMGKTDQGVFALWMGRHYFKRPLRYIGYGGTGKQVRDLVSIDDLADLIEAQLDVFDTLPHRLYNVGGGRASSLSLAQTTAICQQITGNTVEIERVADNRVLDIKLYITDYSRANRDLAWMPKKTPQQTLTDIYYWIRENEDAVASLWQ